MTILQKANQILAEKTNNLLPNVLVTNHTVFGVTGNYTSDGNVIASDIINGKIAYANGERIVGNMVEQGSLTIEPDVIGTSYNAGFYNSINVNAVNAFRLEPNITPNNIANGVSIFNVVGTLSEGINTADATALSTDIVSGKTAYVDGNKITGIMEDRRAGYMGVQLQDVKFMYPGATSDYLGYEIEGTTIGDVVVSNQTSFSGMIWTSTIASAIGLQSNQIANGENVLGVVGTYTGSGGASYNVFFQSNAPATYEGIWFSTMLSPSWHIGEMDINQFDPYNYYNSNQVLFIQGYDYNTKLIGDVTYCFNNVYLTNEIGAIDTSVQKYFGNGSAWVEIGGSPSAGVLTPQEAIEANSTLDSILGQADQGDTDNLTSEEDVEANDIADYILGNK